MSAPTHTEPEHHAQNDWAHETHVYEPHVVGLPPLREYFRECWKRREFCIELANSKLRAQQFNTLFGQLWLVLNPILLAFVYFLLVDLIRKGRHPPEFIAHITVCVFAFYMVRHGIQDCSKSVVKGGKLILNTSFPRLLLPLADIYGGVKKFIPTMIIYIPIHFAFDRPTNFNTLWAIPLIGLFIVLTTGMGVFVAVVQVYFRDLANFLPYALRIMLYTAPVLYYANNLPARYKIMVDINPVGRLLACWDEVLQFGRTPPLLWMGVACFWAFGFLLLGMWLFLSREREIAVRV
ncbi:MAG: teichoic acid transport system permease protein [Solirubrobacteraceae bacterium]|jgi:teichoic acid transport system permease protein|nr:teichoic acid transport system permease protein [Solirubrobacteraceae bacterium]